MEKQQKQPSAPDLQTELGEAYDIPVGGSLGLLALGYSGLMLWRQKRTEVQKTKVAQATEAGNSPKPN